MTLLIVSYVVLAGVMSAVLASLHEENLRRIGPRLLKTWTRMLVIGALVLVLTMLAQGNLVE